MSHLLLPGTLALHLGERKNTATQWWADFPPESMRCRCRTRDTIYGTEKVKVRGFTVIMMIQQSLEWILRSAWLTIPMIFITDSSCTDDWFVQVANPDLLAPVTHPWLNYRLHHPVLNPFYDLAWWDQLPANWPWAGCHWGLMMGLKPACYPISLALPPILWLHRSLLKQGSCDLSWLLRCLWRHLLGWEHFWRFTNTGGPGHWPG